MLKAVLVMMALGLVASAALALASRIFYVKEDPRLETLKRALPGINCGGCGFVGCEGAARALLQRKAPITVCVAGGDTVAAALAAVMGLTDFRIEKRTVSITCTGGNRSDLRFGYDGARDCRAVAALYGGPNPCQKGCLGGGTCVSVCVFHALSISGSGLPQVDAARCRGCGRCAEVCPTGVLSVDDPAERLLHFNQIDECLAPCRQRCPAQIDVSAVVRSVREKRLEQALMIVKERNPFPLTVGRVCPHPCENICRRNISDESVAVGQLERFIGEWERRRGRHIPVACAPDTGRRVAIVGGGPAGLACAYFLRRLGHRPEVFEANPEPGGMLRYGIPAYRLPKTVVDWEIEGILSLGIAVKTGVKLGKDITLTELRRRGYDALFVGIGAWTTPHLCVPGEYATGVLSSLDFLSKIGTVYRSLAERNICIIGESNTAMDCARSSIRLGARNVSVICPCERENMSARKRDVDRAVEEGVEIHFMAQPVRVDHDAIGCVTHLAFRRLRGDCEGSGKKPPRYAPVDGSEQRLAAGFVITAYERKPDLTCLLEGEDEQIDFTFSPNATLNADGDTLLAAPPNIFAAGDLHTGRATVIGAVSGGRLAARSIHHLLTAGTVAAPHNRLKRINPRSILKDIQVAAAPARARVFELPVESRRSALDREVVPTIGTGQAFTEARRCLQCGTYCYDR